MKKITLLLMFFSVAMFSNAAVILDETFDYGVTNLTDVTSWTHTGTIETGTGRTFLPGGMVYSNSGGSYVHSGLGNTLKNNFNKGVNYISYKTFPTVSTGEIYLSFLYKADGTQGQSASEIFGLAVGKTATTVKVFAAKQSDNTANPFRMGVTRYSNIVADIGWARTTLNMDSIYFIVLKFDFGASKEASLFINPTIASASPPAPDAISDTLAVPASFSYLLFRHNGSSQAKFFVSGVRVSTSWAEAVQAQVSLDPLTTPNVGTPSDVAANTCTANWTAVANAVGYDVEVYEGANLFKTVNVAGQSTSSLAISGLMSGISYTYKVIAKGDFVSYSNSAPSAASAVFTTSDPYTTNAVNTDFGDGTWGPLVLALPGDGNYNTYSVNGFDFIAGILNNVSPQCSKGGSHTNRVVLDRNLNAGSLTLPTLNSVGQIEIHATTGVTGEFWLKEFNHATGNWDVVGGPYNYTQSSLDFARDSVYIIPVSRTSPTKFRIENGVTTQTLVLAQVITRPTNPPLLDTPIAGFVKAIGSSDFTAQWSAVANATAYKVSVYRVNRTVPPAAPKTTFTFMKIEDVPGQATEEYQVTGLAENTEYLYRVQAVGDGYNNYADSYFSAASEKFWTLSVGLNNVSTSKLTVSGKTIAASEVGMFDIYNLQGSKVYHVKNVSTANTNLATGLYILQYTDLKGRKLTQKITIN